MEWSGKFRCGKESRFLERAIGGEPYENGPYPTDTRNCIGRRVGLEIEYRGLFRMRRLVGLVQGWSRPPGFYELAAGDTSA